MLTLAGYPLPIVTEEIRALLQANIDPRKMALYYGRSWPGFGQVGLSARTGYQPWPPPVEIGKTVHATGACRMTISWQLCDVDTLDNGLHDAAFGSEGDQVNPVPFVDASEDDSGTIIETWTLKNAYVSPPIPLYRVLNSDGSGSSDGGMYLLVLTDVRRLWWNVATPDFGISDSGGVTWTSLFSSISTALNLTPAIALDTVNSAYLQPGRSLNLTGEPIPLVIASACASIGHKLVVDPSTGFVSTQAFSTAQTAWTTDQNSDDGMARTVRAGGSRFADSL